MPPREESLQQSGGELANDLQVARIGNLIQHLAIPPETVSGSILAKRGVTSIQQLSKSQADDLINRLESKVNQLKAR